MLPNQRGRKSYTPVLARMVIQPLSGCPVFVGMARCLLNFRPLTTSGSARQLITRHPASVSLFAPPATPLPDAGIDRLRWSDSSIPFVRGALRFLHCCQFLHVRSVLRSGAEHWAMTRESDLRKGRTTLISQSCEGRHETHQWPRPSHFSFQIPRSSFQIHGLHTPGQWNTWIGQSSLGHAT